MKYSLISLFIILFLGSMEGCITQEASGGREISGFNSDWGFVKDLPGNNYAGFNQNTSAFHNIMLLHTPKIESLIVNTSGCELAGAERLLQSIHHKKAKSTFYI